MAPPDPPVTPRAGTTGDIDRAFCRELILRVRPLFLVTRPYAPGHARERLLALYAWLAAIEEAVSAATDREVARLKLAWWQSETLGLDARPSDHPVLRALQRSGFAGNEPAARFAEELRLAAARIDPARLTDMAALSAFCERLGVSQFRLECAAGAGAGAPDGWIARSARVNGLVQLIRESLRSGQSAIWWLPPDLSAGYGIDRETAPQTGGAAATPGALAAMAAVAREALAWQPDGRKVARGGRDAAGTGPEPGASSRHWAVYSRLQAVQLRRFIAGGRRRAAAFRSATLGDAWRAWRYAHHWARRA